MENRILKRKEVEQITGLSRSTIYDKMKKGLFPQPKVLSPKSVGWMLDDVQKWLESLPTRVG